MNSYYHYHPDFFDLHLALEYEEWLESQQMQVVNTTKNEEPASENLRLEEQS